MHKISIIEQGVKGDRKRHKGARIQSCIKPVRKDHVRFYWIRFGTIIKPVARWLQNDTDRGITDPQPTQCYEGGQPTIS